MLSIMRVLLILSAVAPLVAQAPGSGTLRGRIVEWSSGLPVVDATVTLYQERASAMVRRSDTDGLFTFENLPPGQHSFRVAAKGYGLKDGKQSIVGSDYQVVDVGPGSAIEIRIEMVPSGSIAGTVRDANDNPLVDRRVIALQKQFNAYGDQVLARANAATRTNSRGEYMLSGLSSGEYFVKVEGQ